jgi:hypothetical protein
MKTQLSKPARSHARYTEQYKKEALGVMACQRTQRGQNSGRVRNSSIAALSPGTAQAPSQSFRKKFTSRRSVEELEAEIRRLRTENAKLLEQREV